MPPVISKLVDAQEPGAMLTPDLVAANESPPVGDSKLAYIIADIISNLKSQQSQSNKTKRTCKYPCSVCSKSDKLTRIRKPYNVTSVTTGLMPLAMVFQSLNMNHLSKKMKAFHGIAYPVRY